MTNKSNIVWVDVELDEFKDYHVGRWVRDFFGHEDKIEAITNSGVYATTSRFGEYGFRFSHVTQIEQRPDPFQTPPGRIDHPPITTLTGRLSSGSLVGSDPAGFFPPGQDRTHKIPTPAYRFTCDNHTPVPLGSKSGFCKTCDCDMILNADLQWVRK